MRVGWSDEMWTSRLFGWFGGVGSTGTQRAGAGVEADRGRGGQVQRFGGAVDRHLDRLIRHLDDFGRQTVGLRAEQPRRREVKNPVVGGRVKVGVRRRAGGGEYGQTGFR